MGFGEWIKLADGTFIEAGSTTKDTPAGLPNIRGAVQPVIVCKDNFGASGALASTHQVQTYWDSNKGDSYQGKQYYLDFNANDYSKVYKDDCTTVQPKSRTAYIYYRKN